MSATTDQLRTQLAGLGESDRAELALYLIQSLDPGSDKEAEAAWDAELARREMEIRSGSAKGEPAQQVFSELRAKHA